MKNTARVVILLSVFIFFRAPVSAQTQTSLGVSNISISSGTAKVMLNITIELSGVVLISSGTQNTLVLPKGIEIIKNELTDAIISAVQTGKPTGKASGMISFKITEKITSKDASSKVKAEYTAIFNDELSVKCFIISNEKGDWVRWPRNFRIKNAVLAKAVKQNIFKTYKKEEGKK